jgi:hypothetical protein
MSATVTELRRGLAPSDQANVDRETAARVKREATEAKVRDQAAKDAAEIARRNGAERLTSQARHALRREGLPCMFIPADRLDAVNAAVAAAVTTWDLDAAVAAFRPFASEPMQYLAAVGSAAARCSTLRGTADYRPDAKKFAAEVSREMKATRKGEGKRAAPRRAAAKPKAAPIVAPKPEPTEEESVPMTETAPETVETVETAPAPAATIPQPLADYLARLVNGSKLTYAAALVAHLYTGADRPEMPSADWAPKVLAKVEKYSGRKVTR